MKIRLILSGAADRPLSEQDFLGDSTRLIQDHPIYLKYDVGVYAAIGMWSVVDVPNKKSIRKGKRQEYIYIVPLVDKSMSVLMHGNVGCI